MTQLNRKNIDWQAPIDHQMIGGLPTWSELSEAHCFVRANTDLNSDAIWPDCAEGEDWCDAVHRRFVDVDRTVNEKAALAAVLLARGTYNHMGCPMVAFPSLEECAYYVHIGKAMVMKGEVVVPYDTFDDEGKMDYLTFSCRGSL